MLLTGDADELVGAGIARAVHTCPFFGYPHNLHLYILRGGRGTGFVLGVKVGAVSVSLEFWCVSTSFGVVEAAAGSSSTTLLLVRVTTVTS